MMRRKLRRLKRLKSSETNDMPKHWPKGVETLQIEFRVKADPFESDFVIKATNFQVAVSNHTSNSNCSFHFFPFHLDSFSLEGLNFHFNEHFAYFLMVFDIKLKFSTQLFLH
jgi:hypothetical protein